MIPWEGSIRPPATEKEELRAAIEEHIEQFLAKGGKIQTVDSSLNRYAKCTLSLNAQGRLVYTNEEDLKRKDIRIRK